MPRRSAVKSRTQAVNQARQLLVTAPESPRAPLRGLTPARLAKACARLRPGDDLADPLHAAKAALRRLGRRILVLTEEINELEAELKTLTAQAAPELLALQGVGADVAGQLLATAGDNPDRLHSEAAFAHLCGVAPIPASSGRRDRHRLNRGGDPRPTTPCTPSCSAVCAGTNAPAPTLNGAPSRACRRRTSCAASSGTSHVRSTTSSSDPSTTAPPSGKPHKATSLKPLDIHRSIHRTRHQAAALWTPWPSGSSTSPTITSTP
ncbi:transposase [Streptomyces tsukubensis]